MNHFNLKSLTFYGVAIGSVLLLFKGVTAYGEKNLTAPSPINGSYRLTLAENLPNCEKSNTLLLEIQQSGIYSNASLSAVTTNADTKKQLSLTGLLRNQQLSLSGKVNRDILCSSPKSQKAADEAVVIQMQLVDRANPTGQLTLSSTPQTLGFTATPEKIPAQSQKLSTH